MKKLVAVALYLPAVALAQQESSVSSGINRAVPYLVGIGMALSVVGLIFAGIKFTSGGSITIAEDLMVQRDITLAKVAGVRYHVAHISTAGAIDHARLPCRPLSVEEMEQRGEVAQRTAGPVRAGAR